MNNSSSAVNDFSQKPIAAAGYLSSNDGIGGSDEEDDDEEFCDVEAWEILSKGFMEVQSVLDQNRRLIQQANENQQSRVPQKLTKNVELIREINSNVSKVIGLYSTLSSNFSTVVQQRRDVPNKAAKNVES